MTRVWLLALLVVAGASSFPTAAALPATWTPTLVAVVNYVVTQGGCAVQEIEERFGLDDGCPPRP